MNRSKKEKQSIRKAADKLTVGAAVLVFAFAGSHAKAQDLIDVDFNSGASNYTQSGAAVLASATNSVTPDVWNGINGASQTGTAVTDTSSLATGVTFTLGGVNSNQSYGAESGTTVDAATANLMEDYAYSNGSSNGSGMTLTLTLPTIDAGDAFTFVVYAAGNGAGQGATLTFDDGAISSKSVTGSGVTVATTTGASAKLSLGQGVAYQEFTGTVAANGILSVNDLPLGTSGGAQYSALNGFQLEVTAPEPQVWAMLGLGLAGLAAFQYRRNRLN